MTIQRMIELLEIEHECFEWGSHENCETCEECDYKKVRGELNEMYTSVIALMKVMQREREPKAVKLDGEMPTVKYGKCPHCGEGLNSETYPHWCGFCGQAVTWDDLE